MDDERTAEEACRAALGTGATQEELVQVLHQRGVSLLGSIKIVRTVLSISLGEAKQVVANHPVWRAELESNQPLHDAVEGAAAVVKPNDRATKK